LLLSDLAADERSAALDSLELIPLGTGTLTTRDELRDDLARVRDRGYSLSVDELEDGLAGLSMAVRGPDGGMVAMISVSGPVYRYDEQARERSLAPLRDAVLTLERELEPARSGHRDGIAGAGGSEAQATPTGRPEGSSPSSRRRRST
jgi:DNA-binding IclR family transcriptional regulator